MAFRSFIVAALTLLLGFPLPAHAANLVGDADNSGVITMADAVLAQNALYGNVGPASVSPLGLADGDTQLDVSLHKVDSATSI